MKHNDKAIAAVGLVGALTLIFSAAGMEIGQAVAAATAIVVFVLAFFEPDDAA